MTLAEKQKLFPQLVARLVWEVRDLGYEVTFGEAWRSPETAALYEKAGKGIRNSLHTQRLAIDLCLFDDGVYLTRSEDYATVGAIWKSYSTPEYECSWGGDFASKDGCHFSISHGGVR